MGVKEDLVAIMTRMRNQVQAIGIAAAELGFQLQELANMLGAALNENATLREQVAKLRKENEELRKLRAKG